MYGVCSGSARGVWSQSSFTRTTAVVAGHRGHRCSAHPRSKIGARYSWGRQPPPPSMLSKPSAPAPRMYEVSTEMLRPPLPLELGGALAYKLCRSSRRSVPATAFLR
ncbi:hypothetical protein HPB50_025921 [Hyalomma asiaticum]|uniref:Uncharacterized protein n=1 Tax=Hyalomma asiaticum TaxID=266040 RepID=A0ACB7TMA6_HYAAI|nr:hypothetical protein HPB50_025921 [Hyalomma asiaticum]